MLNANSANWRISRIFYGFIRVIRFFAEFALGFGQSTLRKPDLVTGIPTVEDESRIERQCPARGGIDQRVAVFEERRGGLVGQVAQGMPAFLRNEISPGACQVDIHLLRWRAG